MFGEMSLATSGISRQLTHHSLAMPRLIALSCETSVRTLTLDDAIDVVGQLELPDLISRVRFSPSMDLLAVSCDDYNVYIIKVDRMTIEGARRNVVRHSTCYTHA